MKKRNKFISTLAAAAMVAVMAGATLPTTALAEGSSGASDGSMIVSKTATLEDDGTYTIQLEAFSTGETLTVMKQTPTDIVLVLDVSGSMKEQLDNTKIDDGYVPATGAVSNKPSDVYHHCPDGTYSTVKWTDERFLGTGHIRFTCDHCGVTRSLMYTAGIAKPSKIEGQDGWALYKKGSHYAYKLEVLQMAAKQFIQEVAARTAAIDDPNNQHKVSIVKFASENNNEIGNDFNNSGYNYTQIVDQLTVVNSDSAEKLKNDIDSFSAAGATSVDYGMEYAKSILDPVRSADRKQVVIVFTDGAPTHSNSFEKDVANAAIGTAKTLKSNGVSIYTIGVFDNANPDDTKTNTNAYMNAMSSNYPEANSYTDLGQRSNNGYYKVAENTKELNNIFTSISEDVNYSKVTLDAKAVIKDIMGDGFTLTDNSAATAYSVPYTGKDTNGNRTFGEATTPYTATINNDGKTVSVTGFDYSKKYLVDSTPVQGEKLVVTITGVEATDAAVTNGLVSTNNALSGIYENADSQNPTVVFPQPQTQLSSKVYVMDYAKRANLTDIPNSLTHMDLDGMHKFSTAVTSLDMTYGKADGTSYTPTTTLWNGYDDYYVFGQWNTTPEGVTTGDNTWTKISVLPANNVYYEDTFVTDKTTDTVGIVYSPDGWNTVAEGSNTGDTINDEHGWITSMNDDTTYSDGTVATGSAGATATFSFTGTGVDIYSRTDMTTGLVVAKLYKGEDTTTPASMVKSLTVDNLAQFGTYYQIPTVSFSNLEHGTYTVKLKVVSTTKTTGKERSTYYLDGIRVYNPLSDEQEAKDIVQEAYGDEIGASFQSVRDILIVANSLEDGAQNVSGAVFIDYNPDKDENDTATSATIKTYEDYGPKNEVYLAQGQAIAIRVDTAVTKFSVGLKAPDDATKAQVTNGENTSSIDINAASDQYYAIVPNSDGYVVIKNTGDNLLSVTKLKMSGEPIESADFSMNVDTAMAYANSFDSLPVVAYTLMDAETAAPDAGEAQEPEQGDADIETPEEPEQGDVVIENPEEPAPVAPSAPVSDSWISELFRAIRKILWR